MQALVLGWVPERNVRPARSSIVLEVITGVRLASPWMLLAASMMSASEIASGGNPLSTTLARLATGCKSVLASVQHGDTLKKRENAATFTRDGCDS